MMQKPNVSYSRLSVCRRGFISKYASLFEAASSGPKIDLAKVARAKTIRDFDEAVICPMFGYSTVEEYYNDATSNKHVVNVGVPLLCLNAEDDPFAPLSGIPREKCKENPNVILATTKYGGHVGFMETLFPWREVRISACMRGEF